MVTKQPDDVIAYQEGVKLFRGGKLLEALAKFKFAAETGVDRPMEHFALASAYAQVGQLAEARSEYRKFLEMGGGPAPQERAAHAALESIERKFAEAEAERRAAAKAEQEQRLAQVQKRFDEAVSYYRAGGYQSALERLEGLLESWGRTAEVLNLVGLCHLHLNDYVAAVTVLDEGHRSNPESGDLLLNLARAHFEGGCGPARAALEKLVELHPERAAAWYNLGVLKLANSDFDGARKAWAAVLEIDPNDKDARANLDMLERRK